MRQDIRHYFEDIAQVLFFKEAHFGLLFLVISLAINPKLFVCGLFASVVGATYAKLYRVPKALKDGGLLTINGFFFGIALASLYQRSPQFYAGLVIGSLAVPIATKVAYEILQHWKLSPFIVSYISVIWILVLCANTFGFQIETESGILKDSAANLNNLFVDESVFSHFVLSIFKGMGRLFFLPHEIYGIVVMLLVMVFSPKKGIHFFLGTAVATLATFALAPTQAIFDQYSHFSYCAGLVGIALASSPEKLNFNTILMFCLMSLFVTMALAQFLGNLGLPLLSLPYVITLWVAYLSRSPRLNVSWA